ncbi:condensation domain-containing protein [Actinoplanes sp. G11-F43]|uniref:condensation domain-containing protein n=1 Tax=Actinoplanes sp. G11-F43 TaxID=3424130 RepID=UPI003D33A298
MTAAPRAAAGPSARAPLSAPQAFLVAFDTGDQGGPFGDRYFNTQALRVSGELDTGALQGALDDLARRHEALRTILVRDDGEPYQEVRAATPVPLVTSRLPAGPGPERDRRAEEFVNEVEAGTIQAGRTPLLRAHLGRFDDTDAVLVLIAHHIATDGWSMRLLVRDLGALYAARLGGPDGLAEAPGYRDWTARQHGPAAAAAIAGHREYWSRKLAGARTLGLPLDHPGPAGGDKVTATYRFVVAPGLSTAAARFAASSRCSMFMVLMAAYNGLLARRSGNTDVVTPTITAGRAEAEFADTVGAFFNFVPLRTDLTDCATWRDVLARTRATCIEAQSHEIPFAEIIPLAPTLMEAFAADDIAVGAMQVFQNPFGATGGLGPARFAQIRDRRMFQPVSSHIPNGILWTLEVDPAAGMVGAVKFSSTEFRAATIADLVAEFQETLRTLVTTPDAPVG